MEASSITMRHGDGGVVQVRGGLVWLVLGYLLAYLFFHATLGWGLI